MDPEFYTLASEYGLLDSEVSSVSDGSNEYLDDGLDEEFINKVLDENEANQLYALNQFQSSQESGLGQEFGGEVQEEPQNNFNSKTIQTFPNHNGSPIELDYSSSPRPRTDYSYAQLPSGIQLNARGPQNQRHETGSFSQLDNPQVAQSIRKVPSSSSPPSQIAVVSNLPEPYLKLFQFTHFNTIQSKCFPTIYKTNHNVLVNAPTGSGKTVLFELAFLRMLEYNPASKGVYMAPTKALCSEKFRDWSLKFHSLGVSCVELTGDSEFHSLSDARRANVIVTTPEKWDSMTRRWFEFTKLLNNLRLVCIDEVHMLNEERGSVLEVIVARMKTLGTNIRFIALSATVPNIQDVAEWLGDGGVADQHEKALTGRAPAKTFIFGDEHRTVKLSKFVYGYVRRPEHTEYQFMSLLNFKLMDLIISHSSGKPTLIFCGTRKSCLQAAETLSKAYQKKMSQGEALPWRVDQNACAFSDKRLTALGTYGIGIHHAGLDQQDRAQMENLFLSNRIVILCTTSTLSVGVNLPARCVIIRGTKAYKGGINAGEGFEEYSDLDLIQMMGRAGRPQFDTEGIAVVMTSRNEKVRIEKLVNSETLLESCLHLNLTEYINSEVNMGTINSKASALDWLGNSFLSVRIKKNTKHYSLDDSEVLPEEQLAKFAQEAMNLLQNEGLIEEDEDHEVHATPLGEIMSKFSVRFKTFLGLVHLNPNATMRNILDAISQAEEFSSLRLRAGKDHYFVWIWHSLVY
ncbi:hypothetical protein O181_029376 [Austropuccinia psidii MF-1]|uniref:DNA 3'-5' helicase n=1 Tax=Austropuccinia psidii MF-1 TaxID=1389203 RepID=A0A9Q3CQX3_9BASI|nr:hypothetical protein [Austropuccinia psidii MF-1]